MSRDHIAVLALASIVMTALLWLILRSTSVDPDEQVPEIASEDHVSSEETPIRRPHAAPILEPEIEAPPEATVAFFLKDKVTRQPLPGVVLKSEFDQIGPTANDGALRLPSSLIDSTWTARLPDNYGGRELSLQIPPQSAEGQTQDIYLPAISRVVLSFTSELVEAQGDTSLLFAPQSLDFLPQETRRPRKGMAALMSQFPTSMHRWLVHRGLAEGCSGRLKFSDENTATIDVNHPGTFNVVVSNQSEIGSLSVELEAGKTKSASINLAPTGETVSGMVVDQDGTPLSGADLRIVCAKHFAEGEVLPDRDRFTGHIVTSSKYTDGVTVIVHKNAKTDEEGRFAWNFRVSDSILIWAFYRNSGSQFAGCGHIAVQAGEARTANDIVVVVTSRMPFGSSTKLTGKKFSKSQRIGLFFSDKSMYSPNQSNEISAPLLIRGDRLLIDMLPLGQPCELMTRAGRAKFLANPETNVFVE